MDQDVVLQKIKLAASLETNKPSQTEVVEKTDVFKKDDSYTVLGVWISNWPDLFPWMATVI